MVIMKGFQSNWICVLLCISIITKLHSTRALEDNNATDLMTLLDDTIITEDLPTSTVDHSSQSAFSSDSYTTSDFTEIDVTYISQSSLAPPASKSWMVTRRDGTVLKLQKCCAKGKGLVLGQPGEKSLCGESDTQFLVDIYYSNHTHYWKYVTSNESFVDIVVNDPCTESKYFLDPDIEDDKFRILHNGSLYHPSEREMYDTTKYCADVLVSSAGSFVTVVLCTPTTITSNFHYFYGSGQVISMILLIGLSVYQLLRTDIDDVHKKCLAWFSATMAAAYFMMALYTFIGTYISESRILAYFLYYLILKYCIWLNVLCYDTRRCVRDADKSNAPKISFMKRYMLFAFIVPVIFIVITFADNFKPALPNLYADYKFSSSIYWCIFLFFLPIGLSALVNIIVCCSISFPKQVRNTRQLIEALKSPDWKYPPKNLPFLRNMYRRSCILFALMFICWLLDFIIFFIPSQGEHRPQFIVRDVASCLQGLFITFIFIRKQLFTSKCKANNSEFKDPEATELQQISNGQQ